ncbi:C39 family peptidase [Deinococcus sp.]|uniref:C39 family peptidase n=1 Tax=Deinococcus sp. TaxID=47478 RepID=UPI0025E47308|nr:C39 family peptidase [Deinococcus sp.]
MRVALPLFTLLACGPLACALPSQVLLTGMRHEYQRLNNCGPVTIGMAMSVWGGNQTQAVIAPVLKPNKNVGPGEMASYASKQGYAVHSGVAGTPSLLRSLVAAGFPVIIETWFVTGEEGGMGHYRLVTGYDDRAAEFRALDSFYGPKVRMPYAQLSKLWRGFGGTYLVVVPKNKLAQLNALLGERSVPGNEWRLALRAAQSETQTRPQDAFAWFNLGTAKLHVGDARGAARAYDRARAAPLDRSLDPSPAELYKSRPARVVGGLPWRMSWYQFGMLETYLRVGRPAEVVEIANAVLRDAPDHEEALYWRGRARAALGQTSAAQSDYQAALRFRPGFDRAAQALRQL